MLNVNRCAKVNIKVVIILIIITTAIGTGLFAARHFRRTLLSEMDLKAGEAAFENKEWSIAYEHLQEYLGRNPDDIEILKKAAEARMSVRPLDVRAVTWAIAVYRRVLQLSPLDEVAYDKLAELYTATGNFKELAYIAEKRNECIEDDQHKARLWLGTAQVGLNKMDEARQVLEKLIAELEPLPDKHDEYVRACELMSRILSSDDSAGAQTEALTYLDDAIAYAPEAVEMLVYRAQFYRVSDEISGMSEEDRLAAAREDLEAADALDIENPRIRLALGVEWLVYGEFDRVAAELQAIEALTQETLDEHYFDVNDLRLAKFLLESELLIRTGNTIDANSLADEALGVLKEKRHRVRALSSAIRLYVISGEVSKARDRLEDYVKTKYTQEGAGESKLKLAYIQALVAKAEEKPYAVINILQSAAMTDASRPELWLLLAEAYSRTEQPRRAINALKSYLRLRPDDPEMALQLAREYIRLGDWNSALKAASLAKNTDPTDVPLSLRLLRIESSIYVTAEQQEETSDARFDELSKELDKLRQKHPDRVDVRILQAIIALQRGEDETAVAELELAIEECPEPLRARMQLARYYYRDKRIRKAIETCQDACTNHSEVAKPWLSMSDFHVANTDPNSARECLKEGLDAAVGRWEKRALLMKLAVHELLHGDRDEGTNVLREVAAQDEQEIRARTLLLGIRAVREDPNESKELVAQLKGIEGESGLQWRLHKALLLLSADDWRSKQQEITDLLRRCIDSDPAWSQPVLLLVNMYEKLENFKRAEDICRQARAKNPSATDVADKLITILEKQRRFSDAKKVLNEIETNERVRSAWDVRLALQEGKFSQAIIELKLRIDNDDRDANSRILLARLLYWQDKDKDGALSLIDEAEVITGDSTMAITAARVSIHRAEGETKAAQDILDKHVKGSDVFGSYMMRAAYLANEGELERAEEDYIKLTNSIKFPEQGAMGFELLSNFYGRTGKLDKAVTTLEEGLEAYPEDLRLKRKLMKTLFLRNHEEDRQTAIDILATLEKKLTHDPELMKIRAALMLEERTPQSIDGARAMLQDAVKLEPTGVDAHLTLIGIAMREGEYEVARDTATRAVGSNPHSAPLLSARGRAEFALKNNQMAIELVHLALQEDPNSTEATALLIDMALLGKEQSILDEARARIESVLARDPANERMLLLRAHVLKSLKLPETAIPELEAYCQTKEGSSSVTAILTLAELHRLAGDMDKAEQKIEQAKQLDPNSLAVVHARFVLLVAQKRFEELEQISSEYISAEKQNPTTLLAAASILSALDSPELKNEGIKLFEHAVSLYPTLVSARLGLASTRYQTGDVDGAKRMYQELLEQYGNKYPENIRIFNDLAWILQENDRDYTAALELASKGLSAVRNDNDRVNLLDTRGTILFNMEGRLSEAKADFEKLAALALSLSETPTARQAKAFQQLGRTCAELKEFDQAKEQLNNALEIDRKINVFTPEERAEIMKIIQM